MDFSFLRDLAKLFDQCRVTLWVRAVQGKPSSYQV